MHDATSAARRRAGPSTPLRATPSMVEGWGRGPRGPSTLLKAIPSNVEGWRALVVGFGIAPGADWPEVRPSLVRAMAGRVERSSGGALSFDKSAAAAIISPVPGRRRLCLIAGVLLTGRRQTALIRPIVANVTCGTISHRHAKCSSDYAAVADRSRCWRGPGHSASGPAAGRSRRHDRRHHSAARRRGALARVATRVGEYARAMGHGDLPTREHRLFSALSVADALGRRAHGRPSAARGALRVANRVCRRDRAPLSVGRPRSG